MLNLQQMRPHTLDEMSTIILIFCKDGANKIELIEKCYLNDIALAFLVSLVAQPLKSRGLERRLFCVLYSLAVAKKPENQGTCHNFPATHKGHNSTVEFIIILPVTT